MSSADEHKEKGNDAYQAKNYTQAIEEYTKAIELNSENYIYYSNRSAAYLKAGLWANAMDDAEKCLALNPKFVKGYGRKAAVLHTMKRYDEAIDVYQQGIDVAKDESDEANAKILQVGLDHAKRAKQLQGHEAVHAVRKANASRAVTVSQKKQAKTATSVGLFVQHTRIRLQMKIQALQARLDLVDSLAKLSDENKLDMLFHLMDLDCDDYIDARELARSLRQRGDNLSFADSVEHAIELMAIFDKDGDAKLNREEFKVFIDHMMANLGSSFHDLAEYLVLQHILPTPTPPQQQIVEVMAGELLAEEMDQEILAREKIIHAVTNPRMKALFELFDKDGDDKVDFKEVAIGLYQISHDMEGALKSTVDILLAIDPNESRLLTYEQFARLILSMVAVLPAQSFDQVADALTVQLSKPTPLSNDDAKALVMADDVYDQCKNSLEEFQERGEVISVIQYDKARRLFDLWDSNSDGAIDFQELLLGIRKFLSAVAAAPDSAVDSSMDESAERAALVLVGFDEDSNQQLNRSEFARVLLYFGQTMDVDIHDLIDFMCLTSALQDNTDYEKAYAKAKAVEVSGQIKALQEMFLAEVDN